MHDVGGQNQMLKDPDATRRMSELTTSQQSVLSETAFLHAAAHIQHMPHNAAAATIIQ